MPVTGITLAYFTIDCVYLKSYTNFRGYEVEDNLRLGVREQDKFEYHSSSKHMFLLLPIDKASPITYPFIPLFLSLSLSLFARQIYDGP
jgi:hypothetical protein